MQETSHPSFEWIRSHTIAALNITVSEYRHQKTGAQHIHLHADNAENVFLVALRTVPEDSTGVAHILEHTALCGSEKYPVRDPFFMMIRRSLNTFMNAFTSSDWTAYPFASQNRKDFDNLLDVYLDAVFFSRLDELDFAQEGHRVDFAQPGNLDSELVYKGVVYNEMKGAMSSVPSQLWHTFCKYLFPTSTYHHNSGGEPEHIPDLSYEQLRAFYKTHYHPSNAIFMTFGDIPAIELQEAFESRALHHFEQQQETISVAPEKRYHAPIRVEEAYPYTSNDDNTTQPTQKTHIVMGWLLGPSIDLKHNLEVSLLSSLLLDNSASPLQHLLETSSLGTSPSPLCGMDESQYEMLFACGIEGSEPEHTQAFEQEVIAVLEKIASDGLPQEDIEASLHQLELRQREIGGDSYPYGLQLILTGLSAATHRGDPVALLDLEKALQQLREDIRSEQYIQSLVQRLLLDNQHRVTLTLRPDCELQERKDNAEKTQLAQHKAQMSNAQLQAIADQATALEQRQQQQDPADILPKVGLEDIPASCTFPASNTQSLGEQTLTHYQTGTNGLVYQQIICPLPSLNNQLLTYLPYYTYCLSEVGVGQADYMAIQRRQAATVGSIGSYYGIDGDINNTDNTCAYVTISAKALTNNQRAMNELLYDTLTHARFDERSRIQELIAQKRAAREQSITGNGHLLAMQAASAGINQTSNIIHQLMGLGGLQHLKELDDQLSQGKFDQLQEQLSQVHEQLMGVSKQWLLIGEEQNLADNIANIESVWQTMLTQKQEAPLSFSSSLERSTLNQAWITNSQVSFCAKAYPTVSAGHEDAAALSVLAGVLRNGYLHRTIREQGGAYGGGASQHSAGGSFRFYSYRDPRMLETLNDFDNAITWLQESTITAAMVEESILGIIGSIDKPGSPAGEAKKDFHAQRKGQTQQQRKQIRERIIAVTAEDLKRVTNTYLKPELAHSAVVTGEANSSIAAEHGMEIITV